ncbi:'5-cyclic nucleotide phosphodiesterase [Leishmania donovani]|uniref:3'_-5'-cyclic_nucleotide_phosphodiesterase_-_putative n=3 Tax=Leishmania donovani species complex TaxID=38574 RepID=A0A6L0XJ36_LEIIN|nr:conserved hypothetical protein [Leishmania infantum JPCM5]CAC9510640.1 3'_-5'-cyclic_nucleotide_phosphodiesterase_-_putative [Leishmania infantum]CAJ1990761.1 '5-cyclic nucleotide phosphodiesterase [Leishmania donovani]CAM69843.1 conserved hypothetical protein [Leishmania infantum JPCM5]SUZ43791.1 3'_-5'-cyclic_nucleotide_phosphodiesterase_-_putative [Leishmania infantum]VDZ46612.1 3' [Leishmania donovani]|eukprot:XP_001466795.1 conserved hypothetical protein [Leishmania infantum JPCM5]
MSLMPGYPVPRAQWVESAEGCAACNKRFTFFTSKENCPCCGRLFCSSCLSAQCALFPTAPPKAVCLDCFRKAQDWRLSQLEKQQQTSTQADVGAATAPLSPSMAVLESKLSALEEEFYRAKANARHLREENDSLIDLLAAKDTCIAELRDKLMNGVSAGAAAQSAEKLQAELQEAKDEKESMGRRLNEAEQRAAGAAQSSEAMRAQMQEHMQAKAEWESLEARLKSEARRAEHMLAQSLEEMSELRAAMKSTNAHSEEQIRQLTAQLQSTVEANAHLQRDYDRNAEALRTAEQTRIASDAHHDEELQRLREHLATATAALAQAQERYEREQRDTMKASDDAATAIAAEKQREIDTLSEQLALSSAAAQRLQGELDRAIKEATRLREEAALKAEAANTLTSELRTQLEAQGTAAQQEMPRQQEASVRLRADLAEKEHLVMKLRRACRHAGTTARAQLDDLRGKLVETKVAYEEGQRSWQAWLGELRAALEVVVQQGAVEVAATSAPSTGAGMNGRGTTKSRWAQPTIIEELQYPSVADVDVRAIEPVPGLELWEFDTVAEAQRGGEADVLLRVGHQIALDLHLFPDRASLHRWACLLATVQANYRANQYHNRVHAADVLQGVYALICSCPGLLAHMTTVEKRAVVFAAAVHDIRHPGRSEIFLKHTFDATYMHYNGLQVLEQMHTATAFHLLATPELDFTRGSMDDTEALEFHGLVAALIGCTFMGRHASLMEQWSRPLQDGKTYDVTVTADRQQVLSLLLHAADIGAQARGLAVALKWLGVVEEMRAQGDEEAARGLPLSPGSSRSASLERGQIFFMEMFVVPLFDLVHQMFPSIESPMRNLRTVHAHYCAALQETRAFPPPVQYRTATQPASNTAETSRAEALGTREAAVRKQEKAVEQSINRLREATAAVAGREKLLREREVALMRAETALKSQRLEKPSPTSSIGEEELLRAITAIMAREAEVQRRVADVETMTAALEERETIASRLSEQLASIADKINRRRQVLRYREARVRELEAAFRGERGADFSSSDYITGPMCRAVAKPLSTAAPLERMSPSSVQVVKLESALEKLTSALRYM